MAGAYTQVRTNGYFSRVKNFIRWFFIGFLVVFGTRLITFVLAIVVGPIVIAIAWFAARPLVSGIIVVLAGAVIVMIIYMKNKRNLQKRM
jgi:cell division protein FtsW (lipid II flippase)